MQTVEKKCCLVNHHIRLVAWLWANNGYDIVYSSVLFFVKSEIKKDLNLGYSLKKATLSFKNTPLQSQTDEK